MVLTRDSSVVLVVRTFLRSHKVIHLRLHHTCRRRGDAAAGSNGEPPHLFVKVKRIVHLDELVVLVVGGSD